MSFFLFVSWQELAALISSLRCCCLLSLASFWMEQSVVWAAQRLVEMVCKFGGFSVAGGTLASIFV